MVSPESHGVSRVVHHKDFYFRGGDMTVMVENHLYRIHSYFFERESLFFRQKLNANRDGTESEERGSSDHNAWTLEDVKSEDFARFLWVFYNPKYSVYEAPLDTWLSILVLANRWTFDNVKELAVRELEKIEIEAVEKIAIYHDNNISRLYLIPSYIAICKRDKSLSFSEGMKLGMETVLRIADARERLRLQASESGIRTPTFEDFDDAEVETLIREVFCLGSRPTSPTPATAPHNATNGTTNGVIKLGNPPPGNPPKANGAAAPRANGGSATDPKRAGVDPIPSIGSVMSQASVTQPKQPSAAPTQERPAPVPQATSAAPVATPASVPPPPPPSTDKPKDPKETPTQQNSNASSVMSPKTGAGEPLSSSSEAKECSGPSETTSVSITSSVVPSSEHSNNVTADSNDNEKEKETDADSTKNIDLLSPTESDTEGGKGKGRGGGRNKRGGQLGAVRGGNKKP